MRWGGIVNLGWRQDQPIAEDPESFFATAYSASGGRIDIPRVGLDNVDEVSETLRLHATQTRAIPQDKRVDVYVCTHGSRDCRCGDTGGAVANALRAELKRRGPHAANRVHVGEVRTICLPTLTEAYYSVFRPKLAHVGGHAWAANLLVYPQGEWSVVYFVYLTPKVSHNDEQVGKRGAR